MGKKCYAVKAGYRAKTAIKVKFAVSKNTYFCLFVEFFKKRLCNSKKCTYRRILNIDVTIVSEVH